MRSALGALSGRFLKVASQLDSCCKYSTADPLPVQTNRFICLCQDAGSFKNKIIRIRLFTSEDVFF